MAEKRILRESSDMGPDIEEGINVCTRMQKVFDSVKAGVEEDSIKKAWQMYDEGDSEEAIHHLVKIVKLLENAHLDYNQAIREHNFIYQRLLKKARLV